MSNLNKSQNNNNNQSPQQTNEDGVYRKTSHNINNGSKSIFSGLKSVVTYEDEPDANDNDEQPTTQQQPSSAVSEITNTNSKPKTVFDGVAKGLVSIGSGIINGGKGIVQQPYKGAKRDGVAGFAKGMAKGIGGAVLLPVVGVCEFFSMTTQGIINTPLTVLDAMKNSKEEIQLEKVTKLENPIFFGVDFEESLILAIENDVPHLIKICIEYLSKWTSLEGMFRISGSKVEIDKLQVMFDSGEVKSLESLSIIKSPHDVACIFKSYFRFLPTSIIPSEIIEKLMELQSQSIEPLDKVVKIKSLVLSIPSPQYNALYYSTEFLYKLSQNSKENLMSASNLSIIFGPSWFRPDMNPQSIANCNTIAYNLILNFDQIFSNKPLGEPVF